MTTLTMDKTIEEKKALNRREFLTFAWLVSIGFMTVSLGGAIYLFAMPRFKEGEFGGKFTLGKVGELPALDAPPANYPKVKLWFSHTEQGLLALYKVCTHLGCLYNWNNQEGKFICPCHGSEFQKDGTYIRGPAPRSLDRFIIEIETLEGEVVARTDETGKPLPLPNDPDLIVKIDTGRRIQGTPHG